MSLIKKKRKKNEYEDLMDYSYYGNISLFCSIHHQIKNLVSDTKIRKAFKRNGAR